MSTQPELTSIYRFHFTRLPLSMRLTYTMTLLVLGLGYLFALIYVWTSHAGRDGDPMLSVTDLIIAYSGSRSGTKLESALLGPMSGMLPSKERADIIGWIHEGAKEDAYHKGVEGIIQKRCLACHDGSNPHIPNFTKFEGIHEVTQRDTGMNIPTLVRVSHIHLFGLTFIFFITSVIFSHAYVRPLWFKCVVIAVPFLMILFDVFSWYLTKLHPMFAWMVIVSGAFMAMAFAIEFFVSLYQMWLYRLPEELEKNGGRIPTIG